MPSPPIVVGTDGSQSARRALDRAAELARALDAPLHIAMSCEPITAALAVSAIASYAPLAADEEGELRHARTVLAHARDQVANRSLRVETHACQGDPADALICLAEDLGAQMIVVGSRGMSGVRRILGSVPNRVSHHAGCAVLIVPTD